jgi:hypothetical protein
MKLCQSFKAQSKGLSMLSILASSYLFAQKGPYLTLLKMVLIDLVLPR